MLRNIHHSIEHHDFHQNSKMKELAMFMVLRTLAISLFAIFIPIFFYNRGEPLHNIFIYYLVGYLSEAGFEIISLEFFRKIGPKKTMALSVPVLIFYFFMLSSLDVFLWPLWSIGLVVGCSLALFWQPYHYLFSKYKDSKKASSQVSVRVAAMAILGALGPALGGYFILTFGPGKLFYLVIVILCLGLIPLLSTRDEEVKERFEIKDIKLSKFKEHILSYMGYTWEETTVAAIWPLFVYLLIGTYQGVGVLTSLTLTLAVFLTLLVGKLSDGGKRRVFIKEGSLFNFLIDLGRTISNTFYHVFLINILRSFSAAIFSSPFVSEYYLHADEELRGEYIFVMELFSDISRIIYFSILLFAAFYFPVKSVLILALFLSSMGALLSGMMPPSKRDLKISNKEIKLMPRPNKARVKA